MYLQLASVESERVPRGDRKQLNVWVSEEAFQGLRAFADEHGCSVTALLDALGRHMATGRPPRWPEVIKEARSIDADRRQRKRDG